VIGLVQDNPTAGLASFCQRWFKPPVRQKQVFATACEHIKNTQIYYIQLLKWTKPLAHYFAKLLHPKYKEAVISRKIKAKQWIDNRSSHGTVAFCYKL